MVNIERAEVMNEIRAIRDEISTILAESRKEHRQDVRDLHTKIDAKFTSISKDFAKVITDVATHKTQLKTFTAIITIVVGAITAWFVSHLGGDM